MLFRPADRRALRQDAERSIRESLSFNTNGVIETCTIIFPGNRGGQLDKLSAGQVLLECSKL